MTDQVEIKLIKGRQADSEAEWFVSLVLDDLKIDYEYQVPILGGNYIAGGLVVDFIIYIPWATPAEVMGEYWHGDLTDQDESFRLQLMEQYFHQKPFIWWDYELTDYQTAYKTIVEDLGL